jgi:hypothetical protein
MELSNLGTNSRTAAKVATTAERRASREEKKDASSPKSRWVFGKLREVAPSVA